MDIIGEVLSEDLSLWGYGTIKTADWKIPVQSSGAAHDQN